MDTYADLQLLVGPVPDAEHEGGVQQVERHGADLARVTRTVTHGQTARHHVRVPDRLHLNSYV